ncbi:MAG: hypothetical protein JSS75_07420 [Bacteroidetes bacterium]|nr:hypothetical protein [Bacteroidota bacterium]
MTAYEKVFEAAQTQQSGDVFFGVSIALIVLGIIVSQWAYVCGFFNRVGGRVGTATVNTTPVADPDTSVATGAIVSTPGAEVNDVNDDRMNKEKPRNTAPGRSLLEGIVL